MPDLSPLSSAQAQDAATDWTADIAKASAEADSAAAQQNTYAELFWRMRLATLRIAAQDVSTAIQDFRRVMELARDLQIPGQEEVLDSLQVMLLTMMGMLESFTEPQAATEHLERARVQAQQQGDQDMSGVAQACLGRAYAKLGQTDDALALFDEIISSHPPGQQAHVTALLAKAETLQEQGDARGAIACLEQVLAESPGDEVRQRIHRDIGRALIRLEDAAEARVHLEEAVSLARRLDLPREQVAALYDLSRASRLLMDLPAVEEALQQALVLLREQDAGLLRAQVLGDLGGVLDEQGRTAEALALLEEGWAWISAQNEDLKAQQHAAGVASRLGIVYLRLQRLDEAQAMLDEAMRSYQRHPDEPGVGVLILLGQGLVTEFRGFSDQALALYQQGLKMATEVNFAIGEGLMLGRLASCSLDLGYLQQALAYGERLLENARARGDRDTEAEALLCLGNVHATAGNRPRGIALVQAAKVIWGEMGSSDVERAQDLLHNWLAIS
jgi:tetratricopeptide (TPR) repeat protein